MHPCTRQAQEVSSPAFTVFGVAVLMANNENSNPNIGRLVNDCVWETVKWEGRPFVS